jgi:hypothetical protein
MALPAPSIGPLSEYLERIKTMRSYWGLDEDLERKGEAESLWFRGRSADWKLMPKLYRLEFKGANENKIRQEFQSRAQQLIQGRLPADKWEWYFLMQHYGAPTRLLDWTDNPLAALYFAVVEHPCDCDAEVWVLNPSPRHRRADACQTGVKDSLISEILKTLLAARQSQCDCQQQ